MSVDNLSSSNLSIGKAKRSPARSRRAKKIVPFCLTFIICFATWFVLLGRFDLVFASFLRILEFFLLLVFGLGFFLIGVVLELSLFLIGLLVKGILGF